MVVLGLAGSAVVAAPLAAAAPPAARPQVAASAVRSLSPAAPDENARTPEPTDPASLGLVIVGTGGLHWTDVERATMPTLWRMVSEGSVASISVRTGNPQTCPVDAWLTLSAGRRTLASVPEAGAVGPDPGDGAAVPADCTPVPVADTAPARSADPVPVDLAGWAALTALPVDQGGGTAGALGGRTTAAGSCATAVGPGAAVALADRDGHVARYVPSVDRIDTALLVACPVTVVDAGEPSVEPAERQAALHDLDALLRRIVETVPEGWRVVVAGVYDTPVDDRGLQVVVDWHRGGGPIGWSTSESTRRPGIVTLADLTATALATVGAPIDDLDGAPLVVAAERRMSPERTVENRRYLTELTTTVPHLVPVLLGVLGLGLLAAIGAVLARRRGRAGRGADRPARVTGRTVTATMLLVASAPAGAYLAALSRWWGSAIPTVAAILWTAVGATAVALVAWALSHALPRGPWRLGGAVAGLTWLILTIDGLTGTTLQHGSILGVTPTLGARYFGFGNLTFAVYITAGLVLSGALATVALARGRRTAAWVTVLVIGLVTVVIDGWPAFGADFGGVFAVVPAFALLLIAVSSAATTPRRVLVTALATVATVTVVALVDWLRPGAGSHLGLFVQRVVDGEAFPIIATKATAAWGTVASPAGVLATVLCIAAGVALVGSQRFRPAAVDQAYLWWPLLRPVTRSVVLAAALGTLLNDSGILVGTAVLAMAGALVAVSWAGGWIAPPPPPAGTPVETPTGPDAPVRRMPAAILAVGGGLLAALLLGSVAAPSTLVAAGDVTAQAGTPVVAAPDQVVVIGTSGVRWQDVSFTGTPTLWRLLRDGAAAGGVTPGLSGANRRCESAGWLALSAGRAPVTGEWLDGTWVCAPWATGPGTDGAPADGVAIGGWDALVELQASSAFRPRLGILADALGETGVCATAVGPGAALALADGSGDVARYRDLADALADPESAFSCPVTVVDAGAAPEQPRPWVVPEPVQPVDPPAPDAVPEPLDPLAPGVPEDTSVRDAAARAAELSAVDATVRQLLQVVPADAVVLVVDVGDPSTARPWLGVGIVGVANSPTASFLSASSTKWEGVIRLLDVPTTILSAVGAQNPSGFSGSPVTAAGPRPSDVAGTVDQLADLTIRDHALRGVAGSITTVPMLLALALLGVVVLLRRRAGGALQRRALRVIDAVLLVIAAMPAGVFLMAAWSWWRLDPPVLGMWASMVVSTLMIAGIGALAPWRPAWVAPALVSAITGGILTLDALLGTPLHRGSPLGPAPTLGGRFYGFGNPTYSVYVVAMVVTAAAVATWLLRRGHRRLAVAAAAAVGLATLVVDLWPTLGADIGGGLVLVPACAVVVLAVAEVRVSWQRLALIGAAGLVAVGAIGVLDWMRPPADRSHLGRFVQSVLDNTALETVTRKAGYAAVTVTSGPTAWLTLAVVLAAALLLWRGSRLRADWFADVERQWPLVRAVLLGLLIAAVGGALVNDYGVRIATVMLFAAVPLVGMLAVRSIPDATAASDATASPDTVPTPAGEPALPCEGPTDSNERGTP